jgi:hypothetical protein
MLIIKATYHARSTTCATAGPDSNGCSLQQQLWFCHTQQRCYGSLELSGLQCTRLTLFAIMVSSCLGDFAVGSRTSWLHCCPALSVHCLGQVMLCTYSDACTLVGAGSSRRCTVSLSKRSTMPGVIVPRAAARQLLGCHLTMIKAAPPNHIQVKGLSWHVDTE